MKEAQEGVVRLDMDKKIVKTIVDYIYGNDVMIDWKEDMIKQYLDIAESFGLIQLKHELEAYIIMNLAPENSIEWFNYADRYQLKMLKKKSRKVLRTNFVKASMSKAFETLSLAEVKELITDEVVASQSTDNVLSTCIYWTLADEQSRQNSFGELVKLVDVEKCSPGYLNFVLETYTNSLITDMNVYARISQGIMASMKLKEVTHQKTKPKTQDNNPKEEEDSIIAIGGQSSILTLNQTIWKIDLNKVTIEEVAVLPELLIRFFPARCLTSLGIFSAGGGIQCLPSTATQDCSLFEVDTGKVTTLPPLSFPTYATGAVAIGNKVYLMGGFGREDQMQYMNLDLKIWTVCARMKIRVQCPIPCTIGHEIFILSNTAMQREISLQCYDTLNNIWNIRTPPPTTVSDTNGACAVAVEFDIFIVGGDGRLCLRYSTTEDRWAILSRPILDHGYGSAVHKNGKILLCGGRDRGQYSSLIEVYDIRKNKWEVCAPKLPLQLLDLSVYLSCYLDVLPPPQDEEDVWVVVKGEDDKADGEIERRTSVGRIKCEVVETIQSRVESRNNEL